ncbi:MAG: hypothetical protein JSW27_16015 [Phycisphaerales bacterium]|nr:MAG: hypothetical protein JSW27_16015 [Phycisphaerales bacterium]
MALIAVLGMALGVASRQFRRPYWTLGYGLSLSLIAILLLGRSATLHFTPPVSWLVATRVRFILVALATTLGLTTPLSRLPRRWEKVSVRLLMAGVLIRFSLMPFLMPALLEGKLARLQTTIDDSGVCRQTTKFTCGPAAAVTALLRLGLPASEGQLAVLAHASPTVGTLPACLSKALRELYGAEGLRCHCRTFDSIAQLGRSGITLAIVRTALLRDHCVTILGVSDNAVIVADPVTGIAAMPREEFRAIWRFSGIVLSRDRTFSQPAGSAQNI